MNQHLCPNCNVEVPFGLQRCIHCGTWIYWENTEEGGRKVFTPTVRTNPKVLLPQKSRILAGANLFADQSLAGTATRNMKSDMDVTVTDILGDAYFVFGLGWVIASSVMLFGGLEKVRIVAPPSAPNAKAFALLNTPVHPGGVQSGTVNVGEVYAVYGRLPGNWVCLEKGWISASCTEPYRRERK